MTAFGSEVLFGAADQDFNTNLWVTDGTAAGTSELSVPGAASDLEADNFLVSGSEVLFTGFDANGTDGLWKTNGTGAGTQFTDIYVGTGGGSYPNNLTNVNGTLFFQANDGTHGPELWKSDGTAAGTVLVKDINPGSAGSSILDLINANGTLYFQANDGAHGPEWCRSCVLGDAAGIPPSRTCCYERSWRAVRSCSAGRAGP